MESSARTGRAAEAEASSEADGVPGRFPPGEIRGALREAERLARYWLIAPLAEGKRVLNVGCGNGEGCEILARAGAHAVVGVDQREAVVEAARPKMPEGVTLERVDPAEPRLPDGDFDLVTCFGPGGADEVPGGLDELVRALSPGGIIAISLPDPDSGAARADAGLRAGGLEGELARRLANVRLYRQLAWTASALLEDDSLDSPPGGDIPGAEARTLTISPRGEHSNPVALASEVPIPRLPQALVLADYANESRWAEAAERQQAVIDAQSARIEELESVAAGARELRRSLVDAEQELAELPELRRRSDELERLRSASRIAAAVGVPVERARGLWLPSLRHRLKLLLERAVGFLRSS
jgi:SAM-dependent methyltransferase